MNKQQLAAKIWASANQMRSKIEANEYKDYILGFIFYKFLSDTEVQRLKKRDFTDDDIKMLSEEDQEMVSYVKGECGYFISYKDLYSTWISLKNDFDISDVRDAFSAFNRNIDPARKRVFSGIFDTLQTGLSKLGTDARSQTKAVRDLIYLINDIPMDNRQDYDVLGYIYEDLISNFASNAGKKAGEFYTPHEVSQLMSEIVAWHLAGRENIEIYDPTSGSGSLLINIGKAVARRQGDPNSIKYFAQELKQNTYNLTRMNLIMRGILADNIVVRNGDTLEEDWPWFDTVENKEETYKPLFVDAVVSNPPYSQNWSPEGKEIDPRFRYGIAPKSKADYAFLLHDLYHLRPDGIMCIVLPHGVLFRGGEEETIRTNLVENRHIRAIIGLPANIFFGTGIPTIIMVLQKQRTSSDVLIVDASRHFAKEGKNNVLQASDIKRIVDVVTSNKTVDKFSRLVSIDEIRANDYNLNIPRYVDSSEPADNWDIYATMFGGVPEKELEALNNYWKVWPSLKNEIYTDDTSYLKPKPIDIAGVVNTNSDVVSFIHEFSEVLPPFIEEIKTSLVDGVMGVDIVAEEEQLARSLGTIIGKTPLVDTYDAYQLLDDAWQKITTDVEIIQTEGLSAVRKVDPNMVIKKKAGSSVEVQDGWKGRILPFDFVQKNLLVEELTAISSMDRRLLEISDELNEMLENFDEEDRSSDAVNEDGTGFVSAELKRMVKVIGKHPETDFEKNLIHAQALLNEEKGLKKEIKKAHTKLEEKTKRTIESLDDEQCMKMLENKWIIPLQNSLASLPQVVIDAFVAKVSALNEKYSMTYSDVCNEIAIAEDELAEMLGHLTGSDYDMAGVRELRSLIGGDAR